MHKIRHNHAQRKIELEQKCQMKSPDCMYKDQSSRECLLHRRLHPKQRFQHVLASGPPKMETAQPQGQSI